jgi:hypothetical protein
VEDGGPRELLEKPLSRYRTFVEARVREEGHGS